VKSLATSCGAKSSVQISDRKAEFAIDVNASTEPIEKHGRVFVLFAFRIVCIVMEARLGARRSRRVPRSSPTTWTVDLSFRRPLAT
jgi:hypothetical protein